MFGGYNIGSDLTVSFPRKWHVREASSKGPQLPTRQHGVTTQRTSVQPDCPESHECRRAAGKNCHRFELITLGEMGGHVARTGNMRIRYKLLDGRPKHK